MRGAVVNCIEPNGSDGFWKATITCREHRVFCYVVESSLTKCIRNTAIVLDAFEEPKKK